MSSRSSRRGTIGRGRLGRRLARVESLEVRSMLSLDPAGGILPPHPPAPPHPLPEGTVVAIFAVDPHAAETSGEQVENTARFVVHRLGLTDEDLVVHLNIGGSAEYGVDYDALADSVTIPAGHRGVEIVVRPIDDADVEDPETVRVGIAEDPAYTVLNPGAVATIFSNDRPEPPPVVVTIRTADPLASETGPDHEPNPGLLIVHRTGATDAELVVPLRIGGSAENGVDYELVADTVTIPAGSATAEIPIRPIDDAAVERPEVVQIAVGESTDGSYATRPHHGGRVLIRDNDAPPPRPVVSLRTADPRAVEPLPDAEPNNALLLVHRTGPTDAALVVHYSIGGTATNGADYEELSGTVEIPAGAATAEIVIRALSDDQAEGIESVRLHLLEDPAYAINPLGSLGGAVIADPLTVPPVDPTDPAGRQRHG